MSYTINPRYPKTDKDSKMTTSVGAKRIKQQDLDFPAGQVADIGKAPTSRVYTRDYAKVDEVPDPDNVDLITPALGPNPFRI